MALTAGKAFLPSPARPRLGGIIPKFLSETKSLQGMPFPVFIRKQEERGVLPPSLFTLTTTGISLLCRQHLFVPGHNGILRSLVQLGEVGTVASNSHPGKLYKPTPRLYADTEIPLALEYPGPYCTQQSPPGRVVRYMPCRQAT